jgi:hypothetical protein
MEETMTRKKLVLAAEALKVETFATANAGAVEGTVHGMELSGAYGPACASDPPNCNDSGRFGPACQSAWPNCN